VALLRRAAQEGYKDIARARTDADFDTLRQRPDFPQLRAYLEAPAPGK
jgi:hypothetical protein